MTGVAPLDTLRKALQPAAVRANIASRAPQADHADTYLGLLPWGIATLLIAAIVHIVSVLLMPAVAPRDALARLTDYAQRAQARGESPASGFLPLPPIKAGADALPFEDPAFDEAVCAYDLSKGPLRVSTATDGEDYLALSFHAGAGRIYHAITDRSAIKGKIDIVVGDAAQIEALEAGDDEEAAPTQEVRLTAPTKRGFVLVRSLAKRPSDHVRSRERLKSVTCERFDLPTE